MNLPRLQRILPLLVLLVLVAAPPAGRSAFEAFLKIDGMEGEATDTWHTNWIVVLGVTNDLSRKAFPMPPEPPVASSLTLVKEVDKASPKLYLACANGQSIREVILDCCASIGGQIGFYGIHLTNVVVKRAEHTGATLGPHGRPMEQTILGYEGISWTYTRLALPSGLPKEYRTSYWNLLQNTGGAFAQAPVFKVTGIRKQPGQVVLSWLSAPGTTYRIFSSPQIDGAFSLLAEVTPTGDAVTTYAAPIVRGAMFFTVEEKP